MRSETFLKPLARVAAIFFILGGLLHAAAPTPAARRRPKPRLPAAASGVWNRPTMSSKA